jgi:hypothetical protein
MNIRRQGGLLRIASCEGALARVHNTPRGQQDLRQGTDARFALQVKFAIMHDCQARSISPAAMPTPLSFTDSTNQPCRFNLLSTLMEPPAGVNFMELPIRLTKICLIRRPSTLIVLAPPCRSTESSIAA